jgi:hypothetical protein
MGLQSIAQPNFIVEGVCAHSSIAAKPARKDMHTGNAFFWNKDLFIVNVSFQFPDMIRAHRLQRKMTIKLSAMKSFLPAVGNLYPRLSYSCPLSLVSFTVAFKEQ